MASSINATAAAAAESSSATAAPPAPLRPRRKLILDTDGGCDDAIALLLAMRDPCTEIVAITSCFGNVKEEQARENIYTILRVFGLLHSIPFYSGASSALVDSGRIETWPGHGLNGLGDASFLEGGQMHQHEAYQKQVQQAIGKEHAVTAMIDLAKRFPGEIDIIALGPLTNLALAARMDPLFPSRIRSVTLMGGSSYAKGNASMAAEFNFYCDPEAAHVVLNVFPSPTCCVTVMPWETTEAASLTWLEFDALTLGHESHIFGDLSTRHSLEASFLKKTHAKYELVCRGSGVGSPASASKEQPAVAAESAAAAAAAASASGTLLTADQAAALNLLPSSCDLSASSAGLQASQSVSEPAEYVCCDSYAVAVWLDPSLATRTVRHYAEVVVHASADIRGMMAIDWYDKKKAARAQGKTVNVVLAVDKRKYLQMMTNTFQPQRTQSAQQS